MKVIAVAMLLWSGLGFSQENTFKALELNLPRNSSEPNSIRFGKDGIEIDGKKCFSYQLFQDVEKNGHSVRNYYEIKDRKRNIVFKGNISRFNAEEAWTDEITFVLLNNAVYRNASVVGRNQLILNLAANQVLGKNCSVNLENLKLFYEKSNENN